MNDVLKEHLEEAEHHVGLMQKLTMLDKARAAETAVFHLFSAVKILCEEANLGTK